MPFLIRPSRRFPVCCPVTDQSGLFEGHGTVWNLSCTGWRLSGYVPMGARLKMLSVRAGIFSSLLILLTMASCITLPPTASLNPPSNTLGPVQTNAWLKRVEITDTEMGYQDRKAQLENTLTNNLLRFLRDGKYFRRIDLLPGTPQPEDHLLHFQFDRYQQARIPKAFQSYDASDLSATLTMTHPDGQIVKQVKASIKEEHPVLPYSPEAAFPSGMGARTRVVEELLRKALFEPNPVP